MSPSREQLLETTNLFIEGLNEFTPESVVRVRSPACTHRLLPATLKAAAPQTNAEYAGLVGQLGAVMPAFQLRIAEGSNPLVDEVARKVTLHTKSRSETTLGLYENEYIWILTMSEDGKTIDDVLEFADSLYTSGWLPKLGKAAAEAAEAAKK
ncbi:hypothetical protein F4820DRAFT_193904 [Hypoxylon rubiginosum]|uniref:Uncharacterized protein n=1 Tax=Hypoxylon rubiginosum TaxID=110542 RepID=A0ACB9YIC9_9PEZI|nr:hypothetical protein F4820DRAFT_193904 [Hypoxylon rubiginosum]